MKMYPQNPKVMVTTLNKRDFGKIIEENAERLKTDYVLVNTRTNEVLVLDGSPADLKFRTAETGTCMPTGTYSHDSATYRLYQVSPTLLEG